MFDRFHGNRHVQKALEGMIERERIPQTLLFAGLEGLGKATLARRFAARLLDHPERIEQDDLSLEANAALIAGREKLPADKRNDDPLVFSSHPDFLTFPPDGPLRQIGIPQMRLLKERAQFKRHPAEILITTPESLYLLLTSEASAALCSVDTVIIDEIHALVPTKRGAHLALSLERLQAITSQPLQRIGLSATQRPLEEVAHFLGGAAAFATPEPGGAGVGSDCAALTVRRRP